MKSIYDQMVTYLSNIFARQTGNHLRLPHRGIGVPQSQLSLAVISPSPHIPVTV